MVRKDVPDLQAQNTVNDLVPVRWEKKKMGKKKNFVVSSVVADGKKVCNKLRMIPDDSPNGIRRWRLVIS